MSRLPRVRTRSRQYQKPGFYNYTRYQPTIRKRNPVSLLPRVRPPQRDRTKYAIVGIGTGRNGHLYQSIVTIRD
ncbi:MAG: hypothetical protein EBE86_015595 [Hormoscilla sp. GUM202]|nr:hypothetical protein [Hormoscilla sp. GUM202]